MIGDFFDWLLGSHARTIVLGIGALATLIYAVVAFLDYRRRKRLDADLERLRHDLKIEQSNLEQKTKELQNREQDIKDREQRVRTLRTAVLGSEEHLWRIHARKPFENYDQYIADRRPKVIMFGNLKGGVGKTTLTANLAADFDTAGKRVLVVDLDYQGSLSNALLLAAQVPEVESRVDFILNGRGDPAHYKQIAIRLGSILPRTWLIPAYYALAPLENRLMVEWLLQETEDDVRYRLARFLFSEPIQRDFDVVLVDVPPRLTTGMINAFCASTHLLVPTILDKTSAEAVGTFLDAARGLKGGLNPGLELLGVAATFTSIQNELREPEKRARVYIEEQLLRVWGPNQVIFERHIPRRAAFTRAAGEEIAYLTDNTVRTIVAELGRKLRERIAL